MTQTAKRYHWISNQALEELLKPKRTKALAQLMKHDRKTAQAAISPKRLLKPSNQSAQISKDFMVVGTWSGEESPAGDRW
jgi:hypothetical protein